MPASRTSFVLGLPSTALVRGLLLLVGLLGCCVAGIVLETDVALAGVIGPAVQQTGNGRLLQPVGRLTTVGNFPTGSAVTPDGRALWVADCGHGKDDVQVVDVASGDVTQTLPLPGCFGGVAFAPDGRHAYVSGLPVGSSPTGGPTKGDGGDVVHVFDVDPSAGTGTEQDPVALASTTGGTGRINSLPPVSGTGTAQPEGLAVSPDGHYLVVALNAADDAVVLDLRTQAQRVVAVGQYPDGVAFDPQGRAYVSNTYSGTVSVIDPTAAAVTATISGLGGDLGDLNSHPEGMVADPQRPRLYVAVTNRDLVAVIDTSSMTVTSRVSVARPPALGTAPTNLAVSPDDGTLFVSDAGEDAIAAISLVARASAGGDGTGGPGTGGTGTGDGSGSGSGSGTGSGASGTGAGGSAGSGSGSATGSGAGAAGGTGAGASTPTSVGRSVYAVPTLKAIKRYEALRLRAARRLARTHGTARTAALRRYHRTRDALGRRYLRARRTTACAGPTPVQERAYVRRVLTALRATKRRRTTLLIRARKALPAIRRCTGAAAVARASAASGARATSGDRASTRGAIAGLPALTLIGRIPTAAYADSVQTTPQGKLLWVAGKGFGSSPNPGYTFGGAKTPLQTPESSYGTYVLDLLIGRVGALTIPSDDDIAGQTAAVDKQVTPTDASSQPSGSPIPATTGQPSSQIKHVFYIVRENRTYDQVLGSDTRGNGDPRLELFDDNGVSGPTGGITPNAHALARQFPLLDDFYEDSEVSVDGHVITAGSYATDYDQQTAPLNYSNRRGTSDIGVYPVSAPPNFYLFDQAAKQGISFRDYGEAVGTVPLSAAPNRPEYPTVAANVATAYPNNVFIGCLQAGNPALCTQDSGSYQGTGTRFAGQSRFDSWYPEFQAQVAAGTVPSFNYVLLPNDHTNGTTANDPTPQAFIADNDLALGQMVDAISHSSIWPSTAIFVVEDDSQDGADHVDSHRSPAFVISPWAKHGAVVHSRFDQYSVLRTLELILGMQPLSLNDGLATPMYDAFVSGTERPDTTPYTVKAPQYALTSKNSASSPLAGLSDRLPFNTLDATPQAISDQVLWASVHGTRSPAPAPGPNASPDEVDRAAVFRKVLREDPDAFRPTRTAAVRGGAATTSTTRCPITWACRPSADGDG